MAPKPKHWVLHDDPAPPRYFRLTRHGYERWTGRAWARVVDVEVANYTRHT